ncbi:MAG: DUF115 domain-containing protein [Chlorobiales bacterium]|nr:DUF115 domain-containing protein [Chlorobiales bacterium]
MNSRILKYKNRHACERAVIVANGPSLNRMDLSCLKDEITIGLNKIFLGFRKFNFYPRYYIAINDKVIAQSVEQIRRLNCVKFISERNGGLIPENALTYHVNTQDPPARFSHDIAQGLHEGWTVTYAALQIAYYLGFKEVVIIGMDHRYEYIGMPNEEQQQNGPDPNHFTPEYFGGGQKWDNPDLANSEESYRIARTEYEKDGRQIIDATLDGSCNIFNKADYRLFFGVRS